MTHLIEEGPDGHLFLLCGLVGGLVDGVLQGLDEVLLRDAGVWVAHLPQPVLPQPLQNRQVRAAQVRSGQVRSGHSDVTAGEGEGGWILVSMPEPQWTDKFGQVMGRSHTVMGY